MTEKLTSIGLRGLMLAGLFAQGLCIAFYLQGSPAESPPTDPPIDLPTVSDASVDDDLAETISPLAHRDIAEEFLKSNDAVQAIPHLLNAAPKRLADSDDALKLRIALCWEASQSYSRAAELYNEILTSTNNLGLSNQSRLGFARCKIRLGDATAARSLLWRQVQNAKPNASFEVESDSAFWLAASYTNARKPTSLEMLSENFLIRSLDPPLDIAQQLAATAPLAAESQNEVAADESQIELPPLSTSQMTVNDVIAVGDELSNFAGSFYASQFNLYDAFRRLTTVYDMKLEITDLGEQLAAQHSVSFSLPNATVIDVLDALTMPYGLGYSDINGVVTVFALREAPESIVAELDNRVAERLLQRSELISQNEVQFGYARFVRAGLLVDQGQLDAAIAIYNDLLQRSIDPRLRQAIDFNLGQIGTWTHQPEFAIESYGRAADSNHRMYLQALAFLKIGQVNLSSCKYEQANIFFSRAAAISDSSTIRSIAKLNLLSSYLLAGQIQLAQKNVDSLRSISDPRLSATAAFLRQLTEFKQSGGEASFEQRERLLAALSQLDWPKHVGMQGNYLIADAYWMLGFADAATEHLKQNTKRYFHTQHGILELERLVAIQLSSGRYTELRQTLQQASSIEGFDRSGLLSYRLADLAFREGAQDDCIEHCQAVLNNPQADSFHSDALVMLGQIFSARGEHSYASLCFAGLLPKATKTSNSEEQEISSEAPSGIEAQQ